VARGNPEVRAQIGKNHPEHVMWVSENEGGSRGFGTTGAHFHVNWAQDDFRKVVLNSVVWIAKGEIPENGIETKRPTVDEMLANHDEKIPAKYRDPGGNWFGFSYRARVIVYNKSMIAPADVATYESLADPKNKGRICTRSGSHPYNLSLIASEVAHLGDAKAEAWAKGVVANMARTPKGGDSDQIKAVAAGECAIALSNTYYYARLVRSTQPADREVVAKTGVVFPDQSSYGTHVNISGAGLLKNAPHKENARKFLEYLASDAAQRYFADGNNEWPVVASARVSNPALDTMGEFKIDPLPIASYGKYTAEAQKIADRAGWR